MDETERRILEFLEGKEFNSRNIIIASQSYLRELVYRKYSASDPKQVEALLLMFEIFANELHKDLFKDPSEHKEKQLMYEVERFGRSLKKTIEKLTEV